MSLLEPEPINVLVVDDNKIVASVLAKLIDAERSLSVCNVARSGAEALRLDDALMPDIILLDVVLPGISGFDLISPLRAKWPTSKVIMLTFYHNDEYRQQAFSAGAAGFVPKTDVPELLVQTIHAAMGRPSRSV